MVLIGAIFLVPVTLLIVLLYLQINGDVAFYELERVGVTYTKALRPLFADLETYRFVEGSPAARAASAKRIDADFRAALDADARAGGRLELTASLRELDAHWRARYPTGRVLSEYFTLLGAVSDNSKITLDPILDGYYVGDAMVNKIPTFVDTVAQAEILGRAWHRGASPASDDRIVMASLLGQIQVADAGITRNLSIAIGAAPYLRSRVEPVRRSEHAASAVFGRYLLQKFLTAGNASGSSAAFARAGGAATAAGYALYDSTIDGMASVLERRIASLLRREAIIFFVVFSAVAAAAALMVATTRSMSRHLADKIMLQHEIVERISVEERLSFTAFHDELTGLANRALLMDRLGRIRAKKYAQGRFWALVFLDLDRFKVVNDSLGHKAGDLVLIEASRRLERCVRTADMLARLGGDEFVILLDDIDDIGHARAVAERVLAVFETPFIIAGRELTAGASIGIATSIGEERPEDVLRNADIAMYRAKRLGKGRFELFAPEMLTSAILRLELETDLSRALDRGELCLFYQPLVSTRDERLVGFEALVRWRHPRRGLVSPVDFIPIAEENGTIIAIGEWIFGEACRQLREWQTTLPAARDLHLNINVSGKQLTAPGFVETVARALQTSGVAAPCINVEITESVLMDDAEAAREILLRVKALGVQIHVDDFGTGYSSLSYLRMFPIDALKIDRSFVSAADDSLTAGLASAEIVRSIVGLAQSLSLDVTAEGTQTAEQVTALRALGCTNLQGFHFSRPVEASAAGTMIGTALHPFAPAGSV